MKNWKQMLGLNNPKKHSLKVKAKDQKKHLAAWRVAVSMGLAMSSLLGAQTEAAITRTDGGKTVSNAAGTVHDIYAGTLSQDGKVAANRFSDFDLPAQQIANLHFKTSAEATQEAGKLFNFVEKRISIAGTVNAIKANQNGGSTIGGELYFLSPKGMLVSGSGVINAGSLTIMAGGSYPGSNDKALEYAAEVEAGKYMLESDHASNITIQGKINAVNNILLQSSKEVMVLNGAQLKVGQTLDFSNLVNIGNVNSGLSAANNNLVITRTGNGGNIMLRAVSSDKNESSTIDDWMKTATENTVKTEVQVAAGSSVEADGTVSLGAHSTLKPIFGNLATFGNITQTEATVEVNGTITAANIAITAENNNAYEIGFLEKGAKTLEAFAGDFLQRFLTKGCDEFLDLDVGVVGMRGNSQVNIGSGANLTATGADTDSATALQVDAKSTLKILDEVGASSASTDKKMLFASGMLYTYVDNDAKVTVADGANLKTLATAGKAGSIKVHADATTTSEANSTVAVSNGALASSGKVASAIVFSRGRTDSEVEFGKANLVSAKDAEVKADTLSKGISNSLVVSAQDTKGSTAILYYNVDSAAKVNVNGTIAAAEKANIAAVNEESYGFRVSNAVNPDGSGSWISLLADPSMGNYSGFTYFIINKAMGNPDAKKLADGFTFGASIGIIDVDNAAKVTLGNTADVSGKNVNINAEQSYSQFRVGIQGNSSQVEAQDPAKGMTNVNAAVGVINMEDEATVNIEGDSDSSHAKVTATEGDLNIKADSEYLWNRTANLEAGIKNAIKAITYEDLRKAKEAGGKVPEEMEDYVNNPTDAKAEEIYQSIKNDPNWISWISGTMDMIFGFGKLARAVGAYTNASMYVNVNVGSNVRPNSSSEKDISIAASGLYSYYDRQAEVVVGRGAELTAKKALNLEAKAKQVDVNYIGSTQGLFGTFGKDLGIEGFSTALRKLEIDPQFLPGWSKSAGDVWGGNLGVYNNKLQSGVLVAEGAKLKGDQLQLNADTDLQRVLVTLGGGAAGDLGVTGMFSVHKGTTDSVVAVDDEATLIADNNQKSDQGVSLKADNDALLLAVDGDVTVSSGSAAIGLSAGYGENSVNTLAGVKDIDQDTLKGASKSEVLSSLEKNYYAAINSLLNDTQMEYMGNKEIQEHSINTQQLQIDATSTPVIWNIAAAGAVSTKKSSGGAVSDISVLLDADALEALNHLDDDEENNEVIGDVNGGEQQVSKVKIVGAGAADINKLKGLTAAVLENTTVNLTDKNRAVALNAYEDGMAVGIAGALSLKTGGAASFEAMVAGTSAVNLVDMDVLSQTKGATINKALAVTNKAKQAEKVVATAAPVAIDASSGSEQSKGFSAALNASVNEVNNSIQANMDTTTVQGESATNTTRVQNYAYDESTQITGGVEVDVAKNTVGVGVNVVWARLNNDVTANIAGGSYKNIGAMENIAASNLTQINAAIGIGVGAGDQSKITAGALWSNAIIDNDTTASITADANGKGATITAATLKNQALDGTIEGETTDDTWVQEGSTVVTKTELLKNFGVDADGASLKDNIDNESLLTEVDTAEVDKKVAKAEKYDTGDAINKDAVATSNYTNSQLTFKDDKKTLVINGGLLIEGTSSAAALGGGGLAIADSLVDNDYTAAISNATITLGNESATALKNIAESDSEIYNIAAGASVISTSGSYLNLAGSAAAGKLRNDTSSTITDATINAVGVEVEATTGSKMVSVAGAITGGEAKGGVGLAIAANDLGNTTEAKILGSTVNGSATAPTTVGVQAKNKAAIYAVGAGIGLSGQDSILAGQGNLAVNVGYNNTVAAVDRSTKNSALNYVSKLDIYGENDLYQAASAAGLQMTGGTAQVGLGFAVNKISDQTLAARLNNTQVTTVDKASLDVKTKEADTLTTVAVGLTVDGAYNMFAIEGAAAITLAKDKQNIAEVDHTNISKADAKETGAELNVEAQEDNTIISNADAISLSIGPESLSAVGMGAAGVELASETKAVISNSQVVAENILVNAQGQQKVYDVGVGAGGGMSGLNLAGSMTFNYLTNDVHALVDKSTLNANNNVAVLAQGEEKLVNVSGGMDINAIGGISLGLAVAYNDLQGDITATVNASEVKALGQGSAVQDKTHSYTTNDKNEMTINSADKHRGLVIDAYGKHEITNVALTLGAMTNFDSGGGIGFDGLGSHTLVDGTTGAYLTSSNVNKGENNLKGDVVVDAVDETKLKDVDVDLSVALGKDIAISGGITIAMADLDRTIEAKAEGNTAADTDAAKRNIINAKQLQIEAGAKSVADLVTVGVGVGGSGGGGVAVGALTDAVTNNKTITATLTNIDSTNKGTILKAGNENSVDYTGVGVLVGGAETFGGSLGVAVGTVKQTNTIAATMKNATIAHEGVSSEDILAVTNNSKSTPKLIAMSLAGGYGAAAIGVAVDNQTLSDKLSLDVVKATIGSENNKAYNTLFNVSNYIDINRDEANIAIAAGLISGSIGVNVQPTTINSSEVMNVVDSSIYSNTIELDTAEYRKLRLSAVNVAMGLETGVGVTRSYTTLGGQLMNTYSTQYNGKNDADFSENMETTLAQSNQAVAQGKEKIAKGLKGTVEKLNQAAEKVVKDQATEKIPDTVQDKDHDLTPGIVQEEGLKLNSSNSNYTATTLKLKSTVADDIKAYVGTGSVGILGVNINAARVDEHLKNTINIDQGTLKAKNLSILGTVTGSSDVHAVLGTVAGVGVNVAYADLYVDNALGDKSGNSITIEGANLETTNSMLVRALEDAAYSARLNGGDFGVVSGGYVEAESKNQLDNTVTINRSKLTNKATLTDVVTPNSENQEAERAADGAVEIVSMKSSTVETASRYGEVGGITGMAHHSTASVEGKSDIILTNNTIKDESVLKDNTGKLLAQQAGAVDLYALYDAHAKAKVVYGAGSLAGGGGVYGSSKAAGQATITADKNYFDLTELNAHSAVKDQHNNTEEKERYNLAETYAEVINVSLGVGVAINKSEATIETVSKTDFTNNRFAYDIAEVPVDIIGYKEIDKDGVPIYEPEYRTAIARTGKAVVALEADTSAEAKADIRGVSVAAALAVGHNSGTVNVKESTLAHMDNSGLIPYGAKEAEETYLAGLSIAANGANIVDNYVDARGGAALEISPKALSAENNLEIANQAAIKGKYEIQGDFYITATQKDRLEIQGSTASGGVLDVAGGDVTNNRKFSEEAGKENINRTVVEVSEAVITAGSAHISASNDMNLNTSREFGMKGGSGGAITAASPTTFTNNMDEEAKVDIVNSTITTQKDLNVNASTVNNVFVKSTYSNGGALAYANKAHATNNFTYANNINVGEGSTLQNGSGQGSVNLSSVDDTNMQVGSYANAYGTLAAIALPVTNNNTVRNNNIDIAGTVYSSGGMKLYAGQYTQLANAGFNAVVDVQSFGGAIIAPVAKNELHNKITENNTVTIAEKGNALSVGDLDIYANEGIVSILVNNIKSCGYKSSKSSEEYYNYVAHEKHVQHDELNSSSFAQNNRVTIDGNAVAGVVHSVDMVIGKPGEFIILDDKNREAFNASNPDISAVAKPTISYGEGSNKFEENDITFDTVNLSFNLYQEYLQAKEVVAQYSSETNAESYAVALARMAAIEDQMVKLGMVQLDEKGELATDGDGKVIISQTLRTDAINLPDIFVSGGDISINTHNLVSSDKGTLEAFGAPKIDITNNTNLYMIMGNTYVGENGGKIYYTNNSGAKHTIDVATAENLQENNELINSLNSQVKDAKFKAITIDAGASGTGIGEINITGAYSGNQTYKINLHDYDSSQESKENVYKVLSDIELSKGKSIVNASGDVTIYSANNNLYINGEVVGKDVILAAPKGSLYQNSISATIDIGGDVKQQYDALIRGVINPETPDNPAGAKWEPKEGETDKYLFTYGSDTVLTTDDKAGRVLGDNVYITAEAININGLIQSGYEDYSYTLKDDDITWMSVLDTVYQNRHYTDDNIIAMGATSVFCINKGGMVWNENKKYYDYSVPVYYNPANKRILIPGIESHAGTIYLTGKIASTGNGRIVAMDGTYDINVDTAKSNNDLKLYGLVTTDNVGKVTIVDTERHTSSLITRDKVTVTPLTGSWPTPSTDKVVTSGSGNYDYQYNPEQGLLYSWIMGMDTSTRTFYERKYEENWWGARKSKDVTDDVGHRTRVDELNLKNDAKGSTDNIGLLDNTRYGNLTIYADKVHSELGTSEPTVTRWETGLWGYRKHELYKWYVDTGDTYQYNISVDASKPIDIKFIGNENRASQVNVVAGGSINVHGNVGNRNYLKQDNVTSTVSLVSEKGAISQDKGIITAREVTLKAAGGINGIAIEAKDKLYLTAQNTASDSKSHYEGGKEVTTCNKIDINAQLQEEEGTVYLSNISGNVADKVDLTDSFALTTNANIVQLSGVPGSTLPSRITAARVDLVSTDGSISGSKGALVVNTADLPLVATDSMSASVNARAKGDIHLAEQDGDMRIGKLISETGDITLEGPGSLVDALPYENIHEGLSDEELIARWTSMGLFEEKYYIDDEGNQQKAIIWEPQRLLYSIANEKINPTGVETSAKTINIKANNLILKMGDSAGLNSDKVSVYKISELGTSTTIDDLAVLAKADASSVEWNDKEDKVTINEKLPIGVELTGNLKIEGYDKDAVGGNAYIETRRETPTATNTVDLKVETIKADGDVMLKNSLGSIYSEAAEGAAAIIAHNLDVGAGQSGTDNGFVGTKDNYLPIDINGVLRAIGTGGVYIKQISEEKPLTVANVFSNGDVYLESIKDLVSTNEGNTRSYIEWGEKKLLSLISTEGSVGIAGQEIRVLNDSDLAEGEELEAKRKLHIEAKKDAYVEGYSLDVEAEEPQPMGTLFVKDINVGDSINVKDNGNIYVVEANADAIKLDAKAAVMEAATAELITDNLTVQAVNGITLTSENNQLHNIAFYNSGKGDVNILNGAKATEATVVTGAGNLLGETEEGTIDGEVKVVAKVNDLIVNDSFKTQKHVLLEANKGNLIINGSVDAKGDVDIKADNTVTTTGEHINAEGRVNITGTNGVSVNSKVFGGGDVTVTAGNSATVGGKVTSGDKVTVLAEGITTGAEVNAQNHILMDANKGNLNINGKVQNAADGIELYAKDGKVDIAQEVVAGGDGLLRIYAELEAGTQETAVVAKGELKSINGSVDVGAVNGNINLQKVVAEEMATVGTSKGNVVLGDISAGTVVLYNHDAENYASADKVTVGKNFVVQSAEPLVKKVEAASGASTITLDIEGTGGEINPNGEVTIGSLDEAVDYNIASLAIGSAHVYSGGNIKIADLYLNGNNTSQIVAKKGVAIDSLSVKDKVYISGYDYETSVYGSAPKYDGSQAIYFDDSLGRVKPREINLELEKLYFGKLDEKGQYIDKQPEIKKVLENLKEINNWTAPSDNRGMNLYINDAHNQSSDGKLLQVEDFYYVHSQRYSAEALSSILAGHKLTEDLDKYYNDGLGLFQRYDLYELSSVEVVNGQLKNTLANFVLAKDKEEEKPAK